jgi:hypothetical protein
MFAPRRAVYVRAHGFIKLNKWKALIEAIGGFMSPR